MKSHKIISLALSFLMIMLNVMPTFAEVITSGEQIKNVYGWDKVKKYAYMTSIKKDSKGNVVYCMDAEKPSPNNDDLPFGGYLDDVAYRILKNGYPNKSFTGNKEKDYVITQLAFWAYVDSKEVNIENLIVLVKDKEDPKLTKYVKDLYNNSLKGQETQDVKVDFSNKNMIATFDGNNYVTPYFRVNVTGNSVSSAKFKMEMKTTVTGVKYQLKDGTYVKEIPMNTDFRVVIPKTAKEGNVSIRAMGQVTGTKVCWYKSPNDKIQNVAKVEKKTVSQNTKDYANITWSPKGNVEIVKKSEDGKLLQGAEFKLTKDGKDVTEAKKTNSKGKVVFNDLEIDTYEVVETKAPQGHVLNTKKQNVTVAAGKTTTVEVTNNIIKGKVKVLKVDKETNKPLQGAEFELREKATGKVVEKLVTSEDGTAISKLHPFGEYILQETKAPNKYVLDSKEYFVTISENMKTINVTAKNKIKKGKIEVNKSDSEIKGLNLKGVEFEITNEDGSVVDTLVTDENGHAESKLLNYGKYFLKETKTLPTHILNPKVYEVNITEDGKVYTYDIKNDVIKGKIQIVKVDQENEEIPVEGAKFNVIADDVVGVKKGTVCDTITSDKDGFAYTKDLRAGRYKIIETFAPEGYWQSDKEYFIDITENGKVYVQKISNKPIQAKLRVLKKDNNTKLPLADAKFKIVDLKTDSDVEFTESLGGVIPHKKTIFKTDENGEFVTPQALKYGKYKLVEVEAPKGYNLAGPIEFEINENTQVEDIELLGTVTTQEVINTRITGSLELLKIDEDTKESLPNVEFEVKCTEGFMKDKTWNLVTDKDGKVSLENLGYGKYKITEVRTLEGYILNDKPIKFEIKEHGETVKLEMTNRKIKGNVEITKVDSEKLFDMPLKDAEFTIYDKDGKEVDKLVTNIFGKAKSKDLVYGKYTMKETNPPKGYKPSDTIYEINISQDSQVINFDIENNIKKGRVEIIKKDSKTNRALKGAEFTIFDEEEKEVEKLVTDKKGYASAELRHGQYTMKETKSPKGYKPSDKVYEINIDEDGKLITYDIKNDVKEGEVEFSKTDISTGEVLEGAKIEIIGTDDINNHIKIEFTSSKEGNKFKVPIGKYDYKELDAPTGYILSEEVGTFEIKEDGEIVKAELKNKKIEEPVKQENPKTGDRGILIASIISVGSLLGILGMYLYDRSQYEYYWEYEDEYED
ncbi:SpaA isopeptide-forming pilin-related protein [Terrisporobacter muris]|uniref:SpaA isopeptide-forming pilin-related protein n=1 Tax=Terrisporobacter muris TaxID=2963284 RepID=A0A9X2M8M3_9FIRM|nr:SpaA isopeptide-forming pilin-related protein [Terrisporobacter muris]MCR1821884.1 SpaA isopeptide-forming pilin-related protein [Terrisporobacter muris]